MLNRALARLGLPLPDPDPDPVDGAGRACAWVVAISIVLNGSRRFALVVVVVVDVDVARTVMVMSGLRLGWVGIFSLLYSFVLAGLAGEGDVSGGRVQLLPL